MIRKYTSPIVDTKGRRIVNRYEAAYQSPTRSYLLGQLQDTQKDIDFWNRSEIARKARYLEKNSPTISGIAKILTTYTVGTGIMPIPATASEGWNKLAMDVFQGWAAKADLVSDATWWDLQQVICRRMFFDGDIGEYFTRDKSGRARIQLIEGHLITNDDYSQSETATIIDGVQVDSQGKPVRYYVNASGKTVPIDAGAFSLYLIPTRSGQHRGISIFHAAINTVQDVEEICALEKQAVKIHSAQEGIIETSGGLDVEDLFNDEEYDTEGVSVIPCDEKRQRYRETLGTETKVLDPGDKYTALISNRPSPAWQGFVSHLLESIALSIGIPPSVLYNRKMGGADSRRDLAAASRSFEIMQQSLSSKFQRVYEYVIFSEFQRGNINFLPADWRRVSWQFPQSITVDFGRDSKADIENLKMGVDTLESIYGRYGLDWKRELEQVAREQAFIKDLAQKYGVEPSDIQMKSVKQFDLMGAGNE